MRITSGLMPKTAASTCTALAMASGGTWLGSCEDEDEGDDEGHGWGIA
jgi:hypothetical protein